MKYLRYSSVSILACLLLSCGLSSCGNTDPDPVLDQINKGEALIGGVAMEYPENETLFPPSIPAPEFQWSDTLGSCESWFLQLSSIDGEELYRGKVEGDRWRPDPALWERLKRSQAANRITFTLIGTEKSGPSGDVPTGRSAFSFSEDSVGASIFYRAVPLPFEYAIENVDEIEWYRGEVHGGAPTRVLDNIPVCANCHSFSNTGLLAMDVDYANDKGSYIITPAAETVPLTHDRIISWSDFRKYDGDQTYGLLSQVSPDGQYVLSTVKDRSVFVAVDNIEYSQLFFPIKGILAYYDRESKEFHELPGADDPEFVQSNPNWSPDSKEVVFARANRYRSASIDNSKGVLLNLEDVQEFISGEQEFKFDLYRLPFDGGKGGSPTPLPGASNNGKSNFFARYSPDGRWLVFCQAENFMLLQPDSKLYIMPAGGGEARLMNCNTGNMNSWHSWSPNGKWLVFSSKEKGPYTQLYLTHIDEEGQDSPPVLLENLRFESRAANIPEFLPERASAMLEMTDNFSRHPMYFARMAGTSLANKKYLDAMEQLEEAISIDSSYLDAYGIRISLLNELGSSRSKADISDKEIYSRLLDAEIRRSPEDQDLYMKRARLKLRNGDLEGALKDGQRVLQMNPGDMDALQLFTTCYSSSGQFTKAIRYKKMMLLASPDDIYQIQDLSLLHHRNGEDEIAIELISGLIQDYPRKGDFLISRGNLMLNKKDFPSARKDFDRAVDVEPDNFNCYRARSNYHWMSSDAEKALEDLKKSLSLVDHEIQKNPQNAGLYLARSGILEEMGDTPGMLKSYEDYFQTWPPILPVLKKQAQIYGTQKDWPLAIAAYTRIIDAFPDQMPLLLDRSAAREESGDLQGALSDLNAVIGHFPREYSCYYARARVKKKLGDNGGAAVDLKATASILHEQSKYRELNQAEKNTLRSIPEQYH